MENLLGIEMVMLVLGIFIVCRMFISIIATVMGIYSVVKNGQTWEWSTMHDTIILTVGVLLIVISQLL